MSKDTLTGHTGEVVLLAMLGGGVLLILAGAVLLGRLDGLDVAAFLLIIQRIVEAVQKRWEQRGVDAANARLHASKPDPEVAAIESVDTSSRPVPGDYVTYPKDGIS